MPKNRALDRCSDLFKDIPKVYLLVYNQFIARDAWMDQ